MYSILLQNEAKENEKSIQKKNQLFKKNEKKKTKKPKPNAKCQIPRKNPNMSSFKNYI